MDVYVRNKRDMDVMVTYDKEIDNVTRPVTRTFVVKGKRIATEGFVFGENSSRM